MSQSRAKRVLKCLSCAHATPRIQAILRSYSVHTFRAASVGQSHGVGLASSGPIFMTSSLRANLF